MANLLLYEAFDFRSGTFGSYSPVTVGKTGLTVTQDAYRQTFTGSFASTGTAVAGKVTDTSFFRNDTEIYRIGGLSSDVVRLIDLFENFADANIYAFLMAGADTITGSAGADGLLGFNGDDTLQGSGGNDLISGMGGDDTLLGGAGLDTALFAGARSSYVVTRNEMGFQVTATGFEGSDAVAGIERLRFADGAVALDTGGDDIGGRVYRLYQAAFDRTPDAAGVGFWIGAMDNGLGIVEVAQEFLLSREALAIYGAVQSNRELITKFYAHILDRVPDEAGLDFWTNVLDDDSATVAQVLAAISDSKEHIDTIAVLIGNGFEYTPYG